MMVKCLLLFLLQRVCPLVLAYEVLLALALTLCPFASINHMSNWA